jgi:hypothetical protein
MTARTAAALLPCYRDQNPALNDAKVKKAARLAQQDAELKLQLQEQIEFDAQVNASIKSIQPPSALAEKLTPPATPLPWYKVLTQPAILAVGLSVLLIVGLLAFLGISKMRDFPGKEAAEKMIELTASMTGTELEPVQTEAGKLGDWFFLKHGLEDYNVPADFAEYKTLGSRVFKQDGHPVAQIAIEENRMLFYIFRAEHFDVQLGNTEPWQLFEQGEWVAAIRRADQNCFMIAFRGNQEQMRKIVHPNEQK